MQYVTFKKAVAQIGCSVRTMRRWAADPARPLKTARLGGMIVTTQEWLDEFALVEKPVPKPGKSHTDEFKAKWGVRT